ncbi:MAG: outer membrane lipoprotein-sorting protein [Candidatus Hydrogenedentes bacterium]|nr:outer membrane lipoprotein-sorting protein [Candidatus Hydrogenedentota bacterium]
MFRRLSSALAAAVALHVASMGIVCGASGEEFPSAEDIITRANARDTSTDVLQTIQMKLIEKDGSVRERLTRGVGKSFDDGRRFALFFLEPSNVRGTALLTFDYDDAAKSDDQWLYLPAMRKTRRISGGERGSSFLGTDFTFEDIKNQSRGSLLDRTWKTVGEEDVDGHSCYAIEGIPTTPAIAKELGYSKLKTFIDKELSIMRRTDFWDPSGAMFKTISIRDYEQIDGVWTARTMEAKNLKTGHATVFTITEVRYNLGLPDDVFSAQTLERGLPNSILKP